MMMMLVIMMFKLLKLWNLIVVKLHEVGILVSILVPFFINCHLVFFFHLPQHSVLLYSSGSMSDAIYFSFSTVLVSFYWP